MAREAALRALSRLSPLLAGPAAAEPGDRAGVAGAAEAAVADNAPGRLVRVAVDVGLTAADDPVAYVRAAAIEAVGRLLARSPAGAPGLDRAVRAAVARVGDADGEVRAAAQAALERMGWGDPAAGLDDPDPSLVRTLLGHVRAGSGPARACAAAVLRRLFPVSCGAAADGGWQPPAADPDSDGIVTAAGGEAGAEGDGGDGGAVPAAGAGRAVEAAVAEGLAAAAGEGEPSVEVRRAGRGSHRHLRT